MDPRLPGLHVRQARHHAAHLQGREAHLHGDVAGVQLAVRGDRVRPAGVVGVARHLHVRGPPHGRNRGVREGLRHLGRAQAVRGRGRLVEGRRAVAHVAQRAERGRRRGRVALEGGLRLRGRARLEAADEVPAALVGGRRERFHAAQGRHEFVEGVHHAVLVEDFLQVPVRVPEDRLDLRLGLGPLARGPVRRSVGIVELVLERGGVEPAVLAQRHQPGHLVAHLGDLGARRGDDVVPVDPRAARAEQVADRELYAHRFQGRAGLVGRRAAVVEAQPRPAAAPDRVLVVRPRGHLLPEAHPLQTAAGEAADVIHGAVDGHVPDPVDADRLRADRVARAVLVRRGDQRRARDRDPLGHVARRPLAALQRQQVAVGAAARVRARAVGVPRGHGRLADPPRAVLGAGDVDG